jgi:hypothetical protein
MGPLRALQPFLRRAQARAAGARCELCGAPLGERHAHVVELVAHAMLCACVACAVLFREASAGGRRYRTVPDRVVAVGAAAADEASWARLEIPVRLAFLMRDGASGEWNAFYPSPAGPVEAPLADAATQALAALVPRAVEIEADVEALLIHRPLGGAARCLVVPIDACYELTGLVRASWRGFDGGDHARAAIDAFVARLEAVAQGGRS